VALRSRSRDEPIDGEAILRRLALKRRDGLVEDVILLLRDTHQSRQFRREFAELLAADFPVPASDAVRRLGAGLQPRGSTVIIV
jgi:hypothetical protein